MVLIGGSAASAHGGESVLQLAITGGAGQTTVRAFVISLDNDPVVGPVASDPPQLTAGSTPAVVRGTLHWLPSRSIVRYLVLGSLAVVVIGTAGVCS